MALYDHTEELAKAVAQASEAIKAAGYRPLMKRASGSAYYGKQDPEDLDVLVLVRGERDLTEIHVDDGMPGAKPENLEDFTAEMRAQGWKDCGEDGNTSGGNADESDYHVDWVALRKVLKAGDEFQHRLGPVRQQRRTVNIIATTDVVWYYRQVAAGEMVRSMAVEYNEVPRKDEVIGVFRCIREGLNPFTEE